MTRVEPISAKRVGDNLTSRRCVNVLSHFVAIFSIKMKLLSKEQLKVPVTMTNVLIAPFMKSRATLNC